MKKKYYSLTMIIIISITFGQGNREKCIMYYLQDLIDYNLIYRNYFGSYL